MSKSRKKVQLTSDHKTKHIIVKQDSYLPEECKIGSKRVKTTDFQVVHQKRNSYEKIKEIPEVRLTKTEMMGDAIELIKKLQLKYKEYGAVKIIACPQWHPPFSFKYTEKLLTTRIQKIHKLVQGKAFDQKIEEYNIKSFTNMAQDFEKQYRFKFPKDGKTIEGQLENQYWHIVKNGENEDRKNTEKVKITVQYAADLPVHKFSSGFPLTSGSKSKDDNFDYYSSSFNLNNTYKCPSSMLQMSDLRNERISGVTTPWVYMGMMFSSFCWHVEDLGVNSINYNHIGNIKTWYIIPEADKDKFDEYVIKKTGKIQLLQSITYMIDPIELIENGIRVYKAYQRPREYILTLFNAYHAGFSQGFNVGEAVNIITADSLGIIKKFINANSVIKGHKAPVICYQWLISNNLNNKFIPHEMIQAQYSKIVNAEYQKLKRLVDKFVIKSIRILDNGTKYDRMTCYTCKFYLYLSALECVLCSKRYCLQHVDKCCGKGFVFVTRNDDSRRKKCLELIEEYLK